MSTAFAAPQTIAPSPDATAPVVLVADDDPSLLDIYSTAFRIAGWRVVAAKNGVETLDVALRERPDLVILDVMMPLKDGYDTLRDLKSNPKTRDAVVIILSNLGQEYEVRRGIKLGAEAFYVKAEVDPTVLVRKMRAKITERRAVAN